MSLSTSSTTGNIQSTIPSLAPSTSLSSTTNLFPVSSSPSSGVSIEERIARLKARIQSCTATRQLYAEAVQAPHPITQCKGEWNFKFFQQKGACSDAFCDPYTREIRLDAASSDDQTFTHAVFELTNAANSILLEKLHRSALLGKFTRNSFAKMIEAVEYRGIIRHHEIIRSGITEGVLDESLDIFREQAKLTFATYWKQIKHSPHTEYYKSCYDETYEGSREAALFRKHALFEGRTKRHEARALRLRLQFLGRNTLGLNP